MTNVFEIILFPFITFNFVFSLNFIFGRYSTTRQERLSSLSYFSFLFYYILACHLTYFIIRKLYILFGCVKIRLIYFKYINKSNLFQLILIFIKIHHNPYKLLYRSLNIKRHISQKSPTILLKWIYNSSLLSQEKKNKPSRWNILQYYYF